MEDKILKATHVGKLDLDGYQISCAVLEDGTRVLVERSMANALGRKGSGGYWKSKKENKAPSLPEYISASYLNDYISENLRVKLKAPLKYISKTGKETYGLEATLLPDICDVWIKAKDDGALDKNKQKTSERAYILLRAFAGIGITALIDEATGFIKDKQRYEYTKLFKEFILEYAAPYEKEFPDEFFDMVYDLYGVQRIKGKNHPQYFAHFIRKYVYRPLAGSNGEILKLLDEKNPVIKTKKGKAYRKKKLFQFLNDLGKRPFRSHLNQLIGIGKASSNKRNFDSLFKRAFKIDDVEQQTLFSLED